MSATPAPAYEVVGYADASVRLLDQTLLPRERRALILTTVDAVAEAIRAMRVRGAPAIGITAGYGLALAAERAPRGSVRAAIARAGATLGGTRPTAVNLSWAIGAVRAAADAVAGDEDAVRAAVVTAARRIHADQIDADRRMAAAGAALIPPGSRVLTHCNTGPLATGGLGTALGVIIAAHREGRVTSVFVDETRPRLQGARLTAWELGEHGVPYRVIADGAAATTMAADAVAAVFVGADRIAANGDVANKIGTFPLAIVARHHGVPCYVVAPISTIDPHTATGAAIPIEERAEDEVLRIGDQPIAPADAHAFNPAFDVTPAELVTAIVTEAGVVRPPYAGAIAALVSTAASP